LADSSSELSFIKGDTNNSNSQELFGTSSSVTSSIPAPYSSPVFSEDLASPPLTKTTNCTSSSHVSESTSDLTNASVKSDYALPPNRSASDDLTKHLLSNSEERYMPTSSSITSRKKSKKCEKNVGEISNVSHRSYMLRRADDDNLWL
jgi:hypothetical protein